MEGIADKFYVGYSDIDGNYFVEQIRAAFSEPWHFVVKGPSRIQKCLTKMFPKLQKEIKKSLVSCKKN
jgi:hypothetical protein